jgi:putative molybdopterin biosynthesis protein
MSDQTKLYTLQEVADILRMNRQTLYNNISRGKLKLTKVGKEYRLTEEQLQDIIKNGFNGNRS